MTTMHAPAPALGRFVTGCTRQKNVYFGLDEQPLPWAGIGWKEGKTP